MSSSEDRLASALEQALKPPWAMYRNVAWLEKGPGDEPANGEADLVVAHPDLGVMVIEVKGGGVRRVGGRWESVDRNGMAHQIKDPFAQVTRAMHRAQTRLRCAAGLAGARRSLHAGGRIPGCRLRPMDDAGWATRDRDRLRGPGRRGRPHRRHL